MSIAIEQLQDHVIPLSDFRLKWRLLDPHREAIPDIHLNQFKPLNQKASQEVWNYIIQTNLHQDIPFKKGFFNTIDKAKMTESNEKEIKKWLYQRGFSFEKQVILSWQPSDAMVLPWKLLIKYYDYLYYGTSDDLTVIDESLNWAMLFYHEDEIYFGTNIAYSPGNAFDKENFIW